MKLSGRRTLAHLNTSLKAARTELNELDQATASTSLEISENRRAQAQTVNRLAKLRLDALASGDIAERINSVDFRVSELLEKRVASLNELRNEVERKEQGLDELEDRRDAQHDLVDQAAAILAEREADVQSELETDTSYQSQLAKTQAADTVAVSAADKSKLANADMQSKAAPFSNDELFSYLWARGYGTSAYSAGPLSRLMDAWVARLCRYEAARQNYWMLLEIPKRLESHAKQIRAQADQELEQLRALERGAADAGGVLAAAEDLAAQEKVQDEFDASIVAHEQSLHSLRESLEDYTAGEDHFTVESLQLLSDAMQREELNRLTTMATSTLTFEDDNLVDELRNLRAADSKLQIELQQYRDIQGKQRRRQQELEDVRAKFKNRRYDDLRSEFDKGDLLISMIGKVLGGAINGGVLWDALRRQQRYRDVGGAWPDFGSGGISDRGARRSADSKPTWHWPGQSRGQSGRRRGGFRLPPASRSSGRSSSRSRGGFRTGGGF